MNEYISQEKIANEKIALEKSTTESTVKIIYILYLVSMVLGITAIVGVIMAYANRCDAPDWLKSHYQLQIRTFWMGSLYLIIGAILLEAVIGVFIILFWFVWLIFRCVIGMKSLNQKEAHPNPTGWLF